jgi:four helix bundle protein
MPVRDFRDLLCWQLSNELSCEVFAFTAKEPASRDFKFCDQIRDSAASAPRNISEGFGRYRPAPFAQYLGYARASLMETQSSLIEARQRNFLNPALGSRLSNLAGAALRVTTKLMLEKQRQASKQPKPLRPEKRSFSITLEELEARRKKREPPNNAR